MEAKQMEDQTETNKSQWEYLREETEGDIRKHRAELLLAQARLLTINEEIKKYT